MIIILSGISKSEGANPQPASWITGFLNLPMKACLITGSLNAFSKVLPNFVQLRWAPKLDRVCREYGEYVQKGLQG